MLNNHKEEVRVAGIAVGVYVAFSLIGALGRKISKVLDKVADELNNMAINVKNTSPLDVEVTVAPAGSTTADNVKKEEKPSE